ncbi:MAG: 4-phosphoerythronate dehydrogenase, partial [Pseudomonadales bacterium]|nr:4-phosphoerythronate dehydrogenase [Pseudomonadales bacterium]
MKIVVDENMPLSDAFFSGFGSVVHKAGRLITRDDLLDADALFVRSITQVDQRLLEGTKVGFVGTATIGVDHIDQRYLTEQGIAYASAPGCNANAVVNYVLTCLLELEDSRGIDIDAAQVGIVGLGNVGKRLKASLETWGVKVVACDPLLDPNDVDGLVSMEEILQSDILSLHIPMVKEGAYPTHYLLDYNRLKNLRQNAVLINTSRGSVIDNRALRSVLADRSDLSVVLDVWENEPMLDRELASVVDIATPHIAGYSYDGKVKGTQMVYQAFCRHLGLDALITLNDVIDHALDMTLDPVVLESKGKVAATSLVSAAYSVMVDDIGLRSTLKQPREQRTAAF